MHCTNGRKHHRHKYLNGTTVEWHHKTYRNYPNGITTNTFQITHTTLIAMSSNDDNTNAGTSGLRGRRGGRAFRGKSSGRGFHFGLDAQVALTEHLVRMGRILLPLVTDAISLTIGNFNDAPLNARKLDDNVYPPAVDRDNVLEADPIYMHYPSPELHNMQYLEAFCS
jgi:hypothetical protein